MAAIVGFAARQTLANLVAGIMLAITQPLRVGDWVTFEDHYGVVEDVRLNFTILRTLSEQRIVIPNERLASGVLRNDTLETEAVGLDVSIWLPAGADVPRALDVLREETGQSVSDRRDARPRACGSRSAASACRPPERAKHEAELREQCLRRLRADGLLGALTGERNPACTREGSGALPAKGIPASTLEGPPPPRAALPYEPLPTHQAPPQSPRQPSQQGPPRACWSSWCSSAWRASPPSATSSRSPRRRRRCPR